MIKKGKNNEISKIRLYPLIKFKVNLMELIREKFVRVLKIISEFGNYSVYTVSSVEY